MAQKNAPGLKFAIETIPWSDVYPKLMTDLAAGRPAHCVSVESPIAFQLMAEGLLEPLDDVADRIGRQRLIPGIKWEYWGAWKGKQYIIATISGPNVPGQYVAFALPDSAPRRTQDSAQQ